MECSDAMRQKLFMMYQMFILIKKKIIFSLDNILENDEKNGQNLGTALEQALKEAVDDKTFQKVKRMSYSSNAADEVSA